MYLLKLYVTPRHGGTRLHTYLQTTKFKNDIQEKS